MEKEDGRLFDVTMGIFDRVKICELVGFWLFEKLSRLIGRENVGLYRDYRITAINISRGPTLDQMVMKIIVLFENERLVLLSNIIASYYQQKLLIDYENTKKGQLSS